jgi:hypothetical protein
VQAKTKVCINCFWPGSAGRPLPSPLPSPTPPLGLGRSRSPSLPDCRSLSRCSGSRRGRLPRGGRRSELRTCMACGECGMYISAGVYGCNPDAISLPLLLMIIWLVCVGAKRRSLGRMDFNEMLRIRRQSFNSNREVLRYKH